MQQKHFLSSIDIRLAAKPWVIKLMPLHSRTYSRQSQRHAFHGKHFIRFLVKRRHKLSCVRRIIQISVDLAAIGQIRNMQLHIFFRRPAGWKFPIHSTLLYQLYHQYVDRWLLYMQLIYNSNENQWEKAVICFYTITYTPFTPLHERIIRSQSRWWTKVRFLSVQNWNILE